MLTFQFMGLFKNTTLRTKLSGGLLAIFLIILVAGGLIFMSTATVTRDFDFIIQHDLPVIANAQRLQKLIVDMETGQRGFVITGQEEFLEPLIAGEKEFNELIVIEKQLVSDNPAQVARLNKIDSLVKEWINEAGNKEIEAKRRDLAEGPVALIKSGVGKNILDDLRQEFDDFFAAENDLNIIIAVERLQKLVVDAETGQRGFVIVGEDEFLEPYNNALIEFDQVLTSLEPQLSGLQAQRLESIADLFQQWDEEAGSKEIAAKRTDLAEGSAALIEMGTGKAILDEIRINFEKFIETENDLTVSRDEEVQDAVRFDIILTIVGILGILFFIILIGFLLNKNVIGSLADTSRKLFSSISALNSSSQQASSSARQNNSIAEQLASASTQQSNQTEKIVRLVNQIVAASEQISVLNKDASDTAQSTAKVATVASEKSKQSQQSLVQIKELIKNTAEVITTMATKSQSVGEIVETITTISEQTNLLALNAAIEAARAGDAGRGFAVVADEVRKLAEGSATAADQIKVKMADMVEQVEGTVAAVNSSVKKVDVSSEVIGETLTILDKISGSVRDVSDKLEQVSSAILDQSAAVTQVSDNVTTISAAAEQNASGAVQLSSSAEQQSAATEQLAAASVQLKNLADNLQQLTGNSNGEQIKPDTNANPKQNIAAAGKSDKEIVHDHQWPKKKQKPEADTKNNKDKSHKKQNSTAGSISAKPTKPPTKK